MFREICWRWLSCGNLILADKSNYSHVVKAFYRIINSRSTQISFASVCMILRITTLNYNEILEDKGAYVKI